MKLSRLDGGGDGREKKGRRLKKEKEGGVLMEEGEVKGKGRSRPRGRKEGRRWWLSARVSAAQVVSAEEEKRKVMARVALREKEKREMEEGYGSGRRKRFITEKIASFRGTIKYRNGWR